MIKFVYVVLPAHSFEAGHCAYHDETHIAKQWPVLAESVRMDRLFARKGLPSKPRPATLSYETGVLAFHGVPLLCMRTATSRTHVIRW